jgi:hypothetical protein
VGTETKNDGGGNDFITTLPEDLRGNATLQKFKDSASLAKSYIEMQGLLGSKVTKPGPDASPEQIAEFYKGLTPEKYDLKFDDLGVLRRDEIITDDFISDLKKEGYTNRQAQVILDKVRGVLENKENAVLSARERAATDYKNKFEIQYGSQLDQVKETVDSYLNKQFGDEVAAAIKQTEAYQNPAYFEQLFKQARAKAPDPGLPKDGGTGESTTKSTLEAKRNEMLNGSHSVFGNALLNESHPKHLEAVSAFEKIQDALQTY